MATTQDLALLALRIYSTPGATDGTNTEKNRPATLTGWMELEWHPDDGAGFSYGVYQNGAEIIVSYAGTNQNIDWLTNGTNAIGLSSAQTTTAAIAYLQAKQQYGSNITFTGHTLGGGAGNDDIRGYGGENYINAWRGGNGRLDGGVLGRAGDDTIIGGAGMDLLRGDAGDDKIYAGSEVTLEAVLATQDANASGLKGDFINGSDGNDVLVGDTGNDALNGGQDDDIILGGAGDDDIRGDLKTTGQTMDWSISRSVTTDANGVTLITPPTTM